MSIVTITINNKKFQLGCSDGQEDLLHKAAQKLDKKIQIMKKASPNSPTELLLIMCALGLQDDNSSLREKMGIGEIDNPDAEKLSQALSTISSQLENLTSKIG